MTGARTVWADGPLAAFATGFDEALVVEGYSTKWVRQLMGLTAEVSRWLREGGLGAGDLTGK
jgi:hypothetical protein